MKFDPISFLACPICHASLRKKGTILRCSGCNRTLEIQNGIVLNHSNFSKDLQLSMKKWNELYKNEFLNKEYKKKSEEYETFYLKDTIDQLNEARDLKGVRYLEIGCGEFFLGQAIAHRCECIIGIDVSEEALKIAQHMLDKKHIHNYLLIQGDILHMPIKNNCIDVIYGGGVIEHFKDTGTCLKELYRVLDSEGVSFNTVPYLNLGSLSYRQVWGNIPNVPILKQIAEFVHIKLLGAKHMKFGYEMSFLGSTLLSLHEQAGFTKVYVDRFRVKLLFEFLPNSFKSVFKYLARNSKLFWPMVKVVGVKKNNTQLSNSSSVLFATFSMWKGNVRTPINGNIEPMRDFFVPKVKKLVIIDQPHPGSDGVMPKIEMYSHNNLKSKSYSSSWYIYFLKPFLEMSNTNATQMLFKIRDFLSVIDWSFQDKIKFDYFIGLESINALAGIFLRKIGRVDTVIYYVFDYSPNRFQNKLFNWIYLSLDRFCAMHADYIWDVSKAMQPARLTVGLDPNKSALVIHVPIGMHPNQIQANPVFQIDKHSLVYMGTLGYENGPDIAIQALSLVRKKFPDTALHVIGGNDKDIQELKKFTLNLKEAVIFHGMIPDNADMSKIMRSCAMGLAPYRNIFGSARLYADSSKIRAYCAAGLPVVSSQVPPLGREVAEKGAGVVAHDDPKSFSKAIMNIFIHPEKYLELRSNAIKLAKNNTWENSFLNAFREMAKK